LPGDQSQSNKQAPAGIVTEHGAFSQSLDNTVDKGDHPSNSNTALVDNSSLKLTTDVKMPMEDAGSKEFKA